MSAGGFGGLGPSKKVQGVIPTNIAFISNDGVPQVLGDIQTFDTNIAGAQTGFSLQVAPIDANFANLSFLELNCVAANVTGCFTNTNVYTTNPFVFTNDININHVTGNTYTPFDNMFTDDVGSPKIAGPPYICR